MTTGHHSTDRKDSYAWGGDASAPPWKVDNAIYSSLGERWYTAEDDPVALLRAESRARNPWIAEQIREVFGSRSCAVLDVGCGGGFLTNALVRQGHAVVGVDASAEALGIAADHDATGRVRYERGDALALPFQPSSFDVVCAMDLLEHVDEPERVVAEASRVLRPGGLFFFHTFNRTFAAWLVVIRGVEWFVKNTPPRLHVLPSFVKPEELGAMCRAQGLAVASMRGLVPDPLRPAFWRMLATGRVSDDFVFHFTRSMQTGYCGVAVREGKDSVDEAGDESFPASDPPAWTPTHAGGPTRDGEGRARRSGGFGLVDAPSKGE